MGWNLFINGIDEKKGDCLGGIILFHVTITPSPPFGSPVAQATAAATALAFSPFRGSQRGALIMAVLGRVDETHLNNSKK
jgi:hypothetical protein